MASINNISIKNMKRFTGHEGEDCFRGDIYLGSKRIGSWSQGYHGEICDDINLDIDYSESKFRESVRNHNKDKERHYSYAGKETVLPYEAENLFTDLIVLIEDEKVFKNAIKKGKKGVILVSNNYKGVYIFMTEENAEHTTEAAIIELYDSYIKKAVKDHQLEADYSVKVYRTKNDFKTGEPIKITDILRS